jgi:glycosyltransferase involved in cell wall biosynthesis
MSLVSIILPSYNHAKFLKDRLESIVMQTFKDWELIIIDDCSSDESIVILENFANSNKDKVKHFIKNTTNSGSGYTSWKKGVELADSEYIWIAETDDFSAPTFLEEQIQLLGTTKAALSFCTSKYVDADGNFLYNSIKRTEDLLVEQGSYKMFDSQVLMDKMPFNTYITNGSSVVFRKPKVQIPHEIFNYKQSSDQFLWSYLIQNNSFVFINKELNYFRRHIDSTTVRHGNSQLKNIYLEKIEYINYFKLEINSRTFLKHYIKHFVLENKSDIFDTTVIDKIREVNFIKLKYFMFLIQFFFKQIVKKLWK